VPFPRDVGLTEKNLAVIRQVMTSSVWGEVLRVPARLMQEARDLKEQAPVKAALRAQLAVAIGPPSGSAILPGSGSTRA
jgi:hypothetical protein